MTQSELSEFLNAPSALFHPEAEKEKIPGQVIHYSGEKNLTGFPIRDDIDVENDEALSSCQDIPFMATDNERSSQKIKEKYCYVLHLYGSLINGQKAVVTLLSIQVFFDILVLDGK